MAVFQFYFCRLKLANVVSNVLLLKLFPSICVGMAGDKKVTLLWITMQPTLGRKHIYDSESTHGTTLGRTLVCYFL